MRNLDAPAIAAAPTGATGAATADWTGYVPESTAALLVLKAARVDGESLISGDIMLQIGTETIPAELTAPLTETPFEALLPIFRGIADALGDRGSAREAAAGRPLTCRSGCAACCRQPVPVAPSEARALAALVAALPEAERRAVAARFAAARAAVAAAGLDAAAAAIATMRRDDWIDFRNAHVAAGIACPFLAAETCSIYADRPIACRELLMTSPAAECAAPAPGRLCSVPIAGRVSAAVFGHDAEAEGHGAVALIDALDWAALHPAPAAEHAGIELAMKAIAHIPPAPTLAATVD
jgi:Fe-S-cluster containining protein